MDPSSISALQQSKRRLSLLRDLARAFEQAQRALVLSDVKGIELHTSRQKQICEELLVLGGQPLPKVGSLQRHRNRVSDEIEELERRVRHLARVQVSLLRRARRAMAIFSRLLASSGITYSPVLEARAVNPE